MTEEELFDKWAYTRGVSGFPWNAWKARAEIAEREVVEILEYLFTLGDIPNVPVEAFLAKWRTDKP